MDQLSTVTATQAEDATWDAVSRHIREAVDYTLRNWRPGRDQWRGATPEQIAEAVTVHAMAAIHPVLFREQVDNGVRTLRAVLERAGIDPASLPWHEAAR